VLSEEGQNRKETKMKDKKEREGKKERSRVVTNLEAEDNKDRRRERRGKAKG